MVCLRCSLCHFFRTVGNSELFDEIIDLTIHNGRQVMLRKTNTVIRNPALRVIVGSDLFRPVSTSYERPSGCSHFLCLLLNFHLVEVSFQHLQSTLAVSVL